MTTPLTDVSGLFRQTVKASVAATFWTEAGIAESKGKQVVQADIVCRESLGELPENCRLQRSPL